MAKFTLDRDKIHKELLAQQSHGLKGLRQKMQIHAVLKRMAEVAAQELLKEGKKNE